MATLNFKKNNAVVLISSIFIDKHMPKANGTFVKVYLYGLMQSISPNLGITNSDIAKALDILESDVYKAWKYWEHEGIIKINGSSNDLDIEFLDILNTPTQKAIGKEVSKPTYHPKELDIYINNNSDIKYLYKMAQERLGKPLSSSDQSTLFGFYDWLRLPVEVIIMLLEYCASIEKRNMRYIEKVAIDWADKGIDNADAAETYLKKLETKNSHLSIIRSALGIPDRLLTPIEMEYIDKWMNQYKFSIEIIKLACEQTILNTSKPTFNYLDSILDAWHKDNVKTVTDVKKYNDAFKERNQGKYSKTPKGQKNNTNKFINYSQDKPDFDELMKLAREKRVKNIKGGGAS